MSMNRTVRLVKRPAPGLVSPDCFEIRDEPVTEPGEGEFRVRAEYVSLDPAMRGWVNEGKSYISPVGIGEVMRASGGFEVDAAFVAIGALATFVGGITATGSVVAFGKLAAGSTELVLSPGRVLAGEVVAAEDGRPLAGARVEAMAALTQSDAGGRFELAVPLEGRAELLVTAADRPATRAREGEGPLRIEVPRGLGARGRVVRSDGAAPGVVELLLVGGQQLHRSFRARSQPDGRFELAGGLLEGEQVNDSAVICEGLLDKMGASGAMGAAEARAGRRRLATSVAGATALAIGSTTAQARTARRKAGQTDKRKP